MKVFPKDIPFYEIVDEKSFANTNEAQARYLAILTHQTWLKNYKGIRKSVVDKIKKQNRIKIDRLGKIIGIRRLTLQEKINLS